jgi:hypothetical protein
MTDDEFAMCFLAETLHVPLYELGERMTLREFRLWMEYFRRKNEPEKEPNLLDDPNALLKAFNL